MRLLLDTHIFLWFISGDSRLSREWIEIIRDPANDVYLSTISIWEASIKFHLGKLYLPVAPEKYFPQQRELHLLASLPFVESDLIPMTTLPSLHRDPFDRMLMCQAIANELIFVTVDKTILAYPVSTLRLP